MTSHDMPSFWPSLYLLQQKGTLCDVQFYVNSDDPGVDYDVIPAHKVVLACCSSYFHAALIQEQTIQDFYHLDGVGKAAMQLLLSYMYRHATWKDIQGNTEALTAASTLGIYGYDHVSDNGKSMEKGKGQSQPKVVFVKLDAKDQWQVTDVKWPGESAARRKWQAPHKGQHSDESNVRECTEEAGKLEAELPADPPCSIPQELSTLQSPTEDCTSKLGSASTSCQSSSSSRSHKLSCLIRAALVDQDPVQDSSQQVNEESNSMPPANELQAVESASTDSVHLETATEQRELLIPGPASRTPGQEASLSSVSQVLVTQPDAPAESQNRTQTLILSNTSEVEGNELESRPKLDVGQVILHDELHSESSQVENTPEAYFPETPQAHYENTDSSFTPCVDSAAGKNNHDEVHSSLSSELPLNFHPTQTCSQNVIVEFSNPDTSSQTVVEYVEHSIDTTSEAVLHPSETTFESHPTGNQIITTLDNPSDSQQSMETISEAVVLPSETQLESDPVVDHIITASVPESQQLFLHGDGDHVTDETCDQHSASTECEGTLHESNPLGMTSVDLEHKHEPQTSVKRKRKCSSNDNEVSGSAFQDLDQEKKEDSLCDKVNEMQLSKSVPKGSPQHSEVLLGTTRRSSRTPKPSRVYLDMMLPSKRKKMSVTCDVNSQDVSGPNELSRKDVLENVASKIDNTSINSQSARLTIETKSANIDLQTVEVRETHVRARRKCNSIYRTRDAEDNDGAQNHTQESSADIVPSQIHTQESSANLVSSQIDKISPKDNDSINEVPVPESSNPLVVHPVEGEDPAIQQSLMTDLKTEHVTELEVKIEDYHGNDDMTLTEDSRQECDKTVDSVGSTDRNVNTGSKNLKKVKREYKCAVCKQVYRGMAAIVRHERQTHKIRRDFICSECGEAMDSQRALDLHLSKAHQQVQFSCQLCGATFRTKMGYKYHMERKHEKTEPVHTCDLCGKTFQCVGDLRSHRLYKHTEERKFSCSLCQRSFKQNNMLQRHINTFHSNERKHQCDICGALFKTDCDAKRHRKRHDNPNGMRQVAPRQPPQDSYPCTYCTKAFKKRCQQLAHEKLQHHEKSAGVSFTCTLCNRAFPIKHYLMQHIKHVHTAPRYPCPDCHAPFTQSSDLRRHRQTPGRCKGSQAESKPYNCTKCDKKFSLKSNLVKHLQHPGRCKGPKQLSSEVYVVVKPTEGQASEDNAKSYESSSGGQGASEQDILVEQVVTPDATNSTYFLDINGQQHALHIDPEQMAEMSQPGQRAEVMELTLDPSDLQEVHVEVLPDMTFRTADGQILHLTQEVSELEQMKSSPNLVHQKETHGIAVETADSSQMESQESIVKDLRGNFL